MSTSETTSTQGESTTTSPARPTSAPASGGGAALARVSGAPPELTSEMERFLVGLLDIQCDLVGGSLGVVYLATGRPGEMHFAAHFVSAAAARADRGAQELLSAGATPRLERLAARVLRAADAPAHGLIEAAAVRSADGIYHDEATHRLVATPLLAEGKAQGVSVLAVPERGRGVPRVSDDELLTRLALTSARFEAFLWRLQALSEAEQRAKLRETLELLDASQQGENAESMSAILCHELARRFGCTRVSIGLIGGEDIRLAAVSGADHVDRKGAVAEAIEGAMEECADQDAEILYPAPPDAEVEAGDRRVTRAHAELDRKFGPSAMMSLPLRVEGDLVGVILLEREAKQPFPRQAAMLSRLVAEFVGPAVWTRRLADRGILAVARDRTIEFGAMLVGPRHTAAKLIGAIVLLVLFAALLVPVTDRARADAEVRAAVSRTIVPPYSGYLAGARVKPGDRVAAGQVIAEMDTRDLDKQIAETEARAAALRVQGDEAAGQADLGKQRVAAAQLAETEARLANIRDAVTRATLLSPLDGVIGRGELDPLVGARVEPTQALFEVVTDQRLVQVMIRERDVGRVQARLEEAARGGPPLDGELTLKARPDESIPLRATRLQPMAEVVRGENVYLLECALVGLTPDQARAILPGVTGIAKIRTGWTTMAVRILRPIVDEIRLRWWL